MKTATLAILLMASTIAFAQAAPENRTAPPPPHQVPPAPPATPTPPPVPLEPKESLATTKLALAESEKANLQTKQQIIINQANQQLGLLKTQMDEKDKTAAQAQADVKKENGWGEDVSYAPPQPQPDGSSGTGKWFKAAPKK